MPGQPTSLDSAFQDLCDRYGLDDPMVMAMQSEIDRRRSAKPDLPFGERRSTTRGTGVWNREGLSRPLPKVRAPQQLGVGSHLS